MRTNRNDVTEVASIRANQEKFEEGHERVFGKEEKKFCDKCDLRLSLCECKDEESNLSKKDDK